MHLQSIDVHSVGPEGISDDLTYFLTKSKRICLSTYLFAYLNKLIGVKTLFPVGPGAEPASIRGVLREVWHSLMKPAENNWTGGDEPGSGQKDWLEKGVSGQCVVTEMPHCCLLGS